MESNFDLTKELVLLYELALNIGQSLDMTEECERFLKTLMSRKNLDFASVWIKSDKDEEGMLLYAKPQICIGESQMPLQEMEALFVGKDFYTTVLPQVPFRGCFNPTHTTKGSFALYKLRELGFILLFSKNRQSGFSQQELNQLRDIMKKFASALEACRLYEQVTSEIDVRIATEERLKQAMEKAEIANVAKSQFLATMSHEIRTPLNGVIGFINLLRTTQLDEEQMDYAGEAKNASDILLYLINDVLDFSKIEAGKLNLEKVKFPLHDSVQSTVNMFRPQAEDKEIEISLEIGEEVPGVVSGDPVRLNQILRNLLSNAVKFTHEGHIRVRLASEKVETGGYCVRFEVTDTGIGIHEAHYHKLFDPFIQADASTTRRYGGTGLGLAICRELVKLMDGQINVDSQVGEGSTFSFTIKLGL